ncbi:hypothetical protein RSOL_203970, partial [Rhizoctonia solani AG-3 Rhs1AP]
MGYQIDPSALHFLRTRALSPNTRCSVVVGFGFELSDEQNDPDVIVAWNEFLAFKQFQAAATVQKAQDKTNHESIMLHSPTVGQSTDLTDFVEEESMDTCQAGATFLLLNSSYAKTGNGKANSYLKRNESGPRCTNHNNEDSNCASLDGYQDNYALNACIKPNAPPAASSSHSTAANKHPCVAEPTSRHNYNDDHHPQKKLCESLEERLSSPISLPPDPTLADLRRANKVVAKEDTRDKELGASRDKVGAKPAAPPKGKEKAKEHKGASRSKRDHVEVDNNDSDDKPIPLVLKKVTRCTSCTLSNSESTMACRPNKIALKKTGKKTKEAAKGPAKSAKHKDPSLPPEESEQEEPQRPSGKLPATTQRQVPYIQV